MARVTWLQRRSTLIGLLVVFVACAVAIIVGQAGTHATYASFVANGLCPEPLSRTVRELRELVRRTTPTCSPRWSSPYMWFGRDRSLCRGAAVVARARVRDLPLHLDPGRRPFRAVVTTLVILALFVTVATCVLGLVLNWFAHPFEVIGIESQCSPVSST